MRRHIGIYIGMAGVLVQGCTTLRFSGGTTFVMHTTAGLTAPAVTITPPVLGGGGQSGPSRLEGIHVPCASFAFADLKKTFIQQTPSPEKTLAEIINFTYGQPLRTKQTVAISIDDPVWNPGVDPNWVVRVTGGYANPATGADWYESRGILEDTNPSPTQYDSQFWLTAAGSMGFWWGMTPRGRARWVSAAPQQSNYNVGFWIDLLPNEDQVCFRDDGNPATTGKLKVTCLSTGIVIAELNEGQCTKVFSGCLSQPPFSVSSLPYYSDYNEIAGLSP